jgi:ribosomal protein L37E
VVKSQKTTATVAKKSEIYEVRCGNCGKKMFEYDIFIPKTPKKGIDKSEKKVYNIRKKCTRCAVYNEITI